MMKKLALLISFYVLHSTFYIPIVYAENVNLENNYGFGYIGSVGEGFSHLVAPGFSIAGVALVFYFLVGAFKILSSGGDKEAVAGARNMITHAIIGFMLLIFMFLLLKFLPVFFGLGGYTIIQ